MKLNLKRREPCGFGERERDAVIELPCGQGEPVQLTLSPGQRYLIVTVNPAQKSRLLAQLPAPPGSAVVTADGGLISNLRIMENLTLPASYHRQIHTDELESLLLRLLHETGLDNQAIRHLVTKLPAQLSRYEKRLVSFTRAALLQPQVLVYDALWDGMTRHELENIKHFDVVLRTFCPLACAIFLHDEHQAGPGVETIPELRCREKA